MTPTSILRMRNPSAGLFLGDMSAPDINHGVNADWQIGKAFQATFTDTVTKMFIHGDPSADHTFNYRLCIYAATSLSVWSGALLGNTADQTNLLQNELRSINLVSPVSIASGNWYALTIHGDSSSALVGALNVTDTSRFFTDTFSDGPAATASASSIDSLSRAFLIYATP